MGLSYSIDLKTEISTKYISDFHSNETPISLKLNGEYSVDDIYSEIEKANDELKAIETMTEGEVCDMYNVDSRNEATKLINEDLLVLNDALQNEIDRLESWD